MRWMVFVLSLALQVQVALACPASVRSIVDDLRRLDLVRDYLSREEYRRVEAMILRFRTTFINLADGATLTTTQYREFALDSDLYVWVESIADAQEAIHELQEFLEDPDLSADALAEMRSHQEAIAGTVQRIRDIDELADTDQSVPGLSRAEIQRLEKQIKSYSTSVKEKTWALLRQFGNGEIDGEQKRALSAEFRGLKFSDNGVQFRIIVRITPIADSTQRDFIVVKWGTRGGFYNDIDHLE